MTEKTYGQVLFEAAPKTRTWEEWLFKEHYEQQAQAVITAFLERNSGKPIAWVDDTGKIVVLEKYLGGGFLSEGRAVPDSWTPLTTGPQPLPGVEEIAVAVWLAHGYTEDWYECKDALTKEMYRESAIAVLALLKEKR
jgi:hypothetical protein